MLIRNPTDPVPLVQTPPRGPSLAPRPTAALAVNASSACWPPLAPKPPRVSGSVNLPPALLPNSLTFVLQPVAPPTLPCRPRPLPEVFLSNRSRVHPVEPSPLRTEALQFDPSLVFLEPREEVCDWLSGRGGVLVPSAGVSLPYLPPFVSSLSTLGSLLRAKKSLLNSSVQLLSPHRHTNLQPGPQPGPPTGTQQAPADRPPRDQPGKPHTYRCSASAAVRLSCD